MIPKISFCLPTFNRLEWIGEAVQSILDQTEKDIEIVIVDDCSTDGTREFLTEWLKDDPRVKLIFNEKNMGAGKARNIAHEAATADIIAVCDSDDTVPEDRAEIALRWFKEHPESELMNSPYVRIGYFGEVLETFYGSEFAEAEFKESGRVNYFCNPSVNVKKDSLKEIGGYPSEGEGMTDDIQMVTNWIKAGKKIDFDNRAFGVLHRCLPTGMMASMRGWKPEWAGKA